MNQDIPEEIKERRWKIRRRFAVVSFVELVSLPFWAGPVIESLQTPSELVSSIIWALVAIIGAYIGGVVIDDNWKKI
jgi:hypothetical protein